jgi:hypothetical protein
MAASQCGKGLKKQHLISSGWRSVFQLNVNLAGGCERPAYKELLTLFKSTAFVSW